MEIFVSVNSLWVKDFKNNCVTFTGNLQEAKIYDDNKEDDHNKKNELIDYLLSNFDLTDIKTYNKDFIYNLLNKYKEKKNYGRN